MATCRSIAHLLEADHVKSKFRSTTPTNVAIDGTCLSRDGRLDMCSFTAIKKIAMLAALLSVVSIPAACGQVLTLRYGQIPSTVRGVSRHPSRREVTKVDRHAEAPISPELLLSR